MASIDVASQLEKGELDSTSSDHNDLSEKPTVDTDKTLTVTPEPPDHSTSSIGNFQRPELKLIFSENSSFIAALLYLRSILLPWTLSSVTKKTGQRRLRDPSIRRRGL